MNRKEPGRTFMKKPVSLHCLNKNNSDPIHDDRKNIYILILSLYGKHICPMYIYHDNDVLCLTLF